MKLVFFDIDGTLLDVHGHVPESTVAAIAALQENGHKAILCTGRSKGFIREKELTSIGFDGIVSGCGTQIEYDGALLFQQLVGPAEALRLVQCIKKHRFAAILEGPRHLYMDPEDFGEDWYARHVTKIMGEDMRTIQGEWENWSFAKFSSIVNHETEEAFFAELGDRYTPIYHNPDIVEVVPAGYDKSSGMAHLCEALGVDAADTMAFGDGMNDMGMLQWAGIGVAMGNGNERIKVVADYVTDDLHEDGIANALRHFGLIS